MKLTVKHLKKEASNFSKIESKHNETSLYGVTDGKKVGTYLEHKFQDYLIRKYTFEKGSSARGIDFPDIKVDMKVTNIKQPQSSSPFESACQKIYGLGHSILVFVYEKIDQHEELTAQIKIHHIIFIDASRTADYQTTRGIIEILKRDGNVEDLVAFMNDRNLPIDDTEANIIAKKLLKTPPELGYLTISNALQWRLQYQRAIQNADTIKGIDSIKYG